MYFLSKFATDLYNKQQVWTKNYFFWWLWCWLQITTSALSGKVTTQDTKEEVIGATVQGPKTTYGSTVELIDVSVVNIKKSIVKVDSLSIDTLPKAGGEVIAYLTNKGEGVDVKIPEEAESWLSIKSINTKNGTSTVVFKANANKGGAFYFEPKK